MASEPDEHAETGVTTPARAPSASPATAAAPLGMTICTAVLALACEWTQRYLPTRTAEITSVLLAIGMGWLLSVCTTARRPRNVGM